MNIETKILPDPHLVIRHYNPAEFFDGHIEAEGFLAKRNGDITRTFRANFHGIREGNDININEVITFDNGEQERRHWKIKYIAAGHWQAVAEGVVGVCTIRSGTKPAEGRWSYRMKIVVGKRAIAFDFEDIMVMLSNSDMVSLTPMKKFGITLAQISCHYRRI